MYRYEVIICDGHDTSWIDIFTVFACDEEDAKELAISEAFMSGMELGEVLSINQYDNLFDIWDLCDYAFDEDSEIYELIHKIADNFEYLIFENPDIYYGLMDCSENIKCLLCYAYFYLTKQTYCKSSYTKRDLTLTMQYILSELDLLSGYTYNDNFRVIIDAINIIYVNYAAKAVYNYGKRGA